VLRATKMAAEVRRTSPLRRGLRRYDSLSGLAKLVRRTSPLRRGLRQVLLGFDLDLSTLPSQQPSCRAASRPHLPPPHWQACQTHSLPPPPAHCIHRFGNEPITPQRKERTPCPSPNPSPSAWPATNCPRSSPSAPRSAQVAPPWTPATSPSSAAPPPPPPTSEQPPP